MADSSLPVTPGSGTNVDGHILTNGNFRQSVVVGDPSDPTKVAPVDAVFGLFTKITNFPSVQPVQIGITPLVTAMVTSFRTVGIASSPHNLFTLENPVGSGRTLAIIRITMQAESTALSTNLVAVSAGRTPGIPTGGTILSSDKCEVTGTISGIARGATASDGGAATPITATLTTRMWSQFRQRLITAAGYITTPDNTVLPNLISDRPLLIPAGTGIVVQAVNSALTTDHYIINCMWYEY